MTHVITPLICSVVGARGFEPPTSASRTLRSTRLSHAPTIELLGAEGGSRTHMELPPTVFETVASAIPPLRHHTGHYS